MKIQANNNSYSTTLRLPAAMSTPEIQSPGALRMHISRAMSETKCRIHRGGVRRTS